MIWGEIWIAFTLLTIGLAWLSKSRIYLLTSFLLLGWMTYAKAIYIPGVLNSVETMAAAMLHALALSIGLVFTRHRMFAYQLIFPALVMIGTQIIQDVYWFRSINNGLYGAGLLLLCVFCVRDVWKSKVQVPLRH